MSNADRPIPATVDTVLSGPAVLTGARSFAVAVVCPDGWPTTTAEQLPVLVLAADMAAESFQRRGIPSPPGGWTFALLDPAAEPWRDHLAPDIAPDIAAAVAADLARRPPGAAVAVVVAVASSTRRPK